MRTVYFEPAPRLNNALHIYMSTLSCSYITTSSFEAIVALNKEPLWRMLMKRCDLMMTKAADLDRFLHENEDNPFYPKVKLEHVDDDLLMEIMLLASREDRVEYR